MANAETFIPIASRPPPVQSTGAVQWVRTHLFGGWGNTLATLVGPVFDKIAGSLVDAFVKRADQVYGT